MKKWSIFGILCIVLIAIAATACAEQAIVVSTRCTVRETASYSGKAVTTLHNHDTVEVVGIQGDFYLVTYESCGVNSPNGSTYGYVARKWLRTGTQETIVLTQQTDFWARPGSSLAVAQKTSGTELIVLEHWYVDGQDWLVVQVQPDVGGVGFLAASNRGYRTNYSEQPMTSSSPTSLYAMVNCSTLAVRAQRRDDLDPFAYLHNGDIVEVSEWGDYFSAVVVNYNGYEVIGYVHTQYLLPIQ